MKSSGSPAEKLERAAARRVLIGEVPRRFQVEVQRSMDEHPDAMDALQALAAECGGRERARLRKLARLWSHRPSHLPMSSPGGARRKATFPLGVSLLPGQDTIEFLRPLLITEHKGPGLNISRFAGFGYSGFIILITAVFSIFVGPVYTAVFQNLSVTPASTILRLSQSIQVWCVMALIAIGLYAVVLRYSRKWRFRRQQRINSEAARLLELGVTCQNLALTGVPGRFGTWRYSRQIGFVLDQAKNDSEGASALRRVAKAYQAGQEQSQGGMLPGTTTVIAGMFVFCVALSVLYPLIALILNLS